MTTVVVAIVAFAPAASSRSTAQLLTFDFPSWSHDGKRIALVGQVGQGDSFLYVVTANGRNLHKIDTTGIDARPNLPDRVKFPSWSPTDDRIAFAEGGAVPSIWVIGSNGRGLRRLIEWAIAPAWSPGGRRIAYSDIDESNGSNIHVIRPDGNDDQVAAEPEDTQSFQGPTWSPDGERLAFFIYAAPNSFSDAAGIGITHDYGAHPRFLLVDHTVHGLSWSPSGRELAFVEDGLIWFLDLRTKRIKRLEYGDFPSWAPDGRRLVFSNSGSIYTMNRDGSQVRRILRPR